jgi:hypothetical protein
MKIAPYLIAAILLVSPQPAKSQEFEDIVRERVVNRPQPVESQGISKHGGIFYVPDSQMARFNRMVNRETTLLFKRRSSTPRYTPLIIKRDLNKKCPCNGKRDHKKKDHNTHKEGAELEEEESDEASA